MRHHLVRLRRLPHPIIAAIIAVAVAVFVAQEALGLPLPWRYGTVPREFRDLGAELLEGQWSVASLAVLLKLFTPLFLHGGFEHILFNMIFLWTFGTLCAGLLGQWRALGLFFFCGAAGNVAQIALNPDSPIPIIGASGAIAGFEGVYLGLALRWRLDWPDVWPLAHPIPPMQLVAFAALGLAADFYFLGDHQQPVAHGAHVGGFLAGLLAAAVLTQIYPTREGYRRT